MERIAANRNGHNKLFLLIAVLLASIAWVTVMSVKAEAAVNYEASYNNMPTELPDDAYDLVPKSGSGGQCGVVAHQCNAANITYLPNNTSRTHQYLTLGNQSINDDRSRTAVDDTYSADRMAFFIYTRYPNTAKDVRITNVDRALDPVATCYNRLVATYYRITQVTSQGSVMASDKLPYPNGASNGIPTTGCGQTYTFPFKYPAAGFTEMKDRYGNGTGIYRGIIMVAFDNQNPSVNRQTSFHISVEASARIGHYGAINNVLPDFAQRPMANQYPTALGDGNELAFYFRPPCTIAGGTNFEINWGDANEGTQFQGTDGRLLIYKYKPEDNPHSRSGMTLVATTEALERAWTYRSINVETYDGGKPYAYMAVFENIKGGNGISFSHPFDSADSRVACPDPPPAANADCTVFRHSLGGNSLYKFTVFGENNNYVSAEPATQNSRYGSAVGWRSYNAPNEQVVSPSKTGSSGNSGFRFNHTTPSGSGRLVYIERWEERTAGNWYYTAGQSWVENCYSATCTVSVSATIPGDGYGVRSGEQFTLLGTITNTGQADLPANYGSTRLGLTVDGWGRPHAYTSGALARGTSQAVSTTLTAPAGRHALTINAYPDYDGVKGLGGICSTPVNIYERYDFNATATTVLDNAEGPTRATFNTSISQAGVDVDSRSERSFYKIRNGAYSNLPIGPISDVRNYGNAAYTDVYGIPSGSIQLGDGFCTLIYLELGHGWRGPNGLYSNDGPEQANDCGPGVPVDIICVPGTPPCPGGDTPLSVINMPYIKAYGADVAAGGGFGASCSRLASRISTFIRPLSQHRPSDGTDLSNKSGSGGQIAAMALGDITGFTSASSRTSGASSPNGLTFAHTNAVPDQMSNTPHLGGGMAGDGWCMPDYFASTQFIDSPKKDVSNATTDIDVLSLPDNQQTVRNVGASKVNVVGNNGAEYTSHHTVYIEGDAYINQNIRYRTNYSAGVAAIPSFSLIVKGNIYVDSEVTQLDGLYIAQPANGRPNTGRIYTCSNNTSGITDPVMMFNICGAAQTLTDTAACSGSRTKQLTVNGAFIAQKVILNRTGHSIRNSCFREEASATKAAEVFNFSPEMYLSPPVFRPTGTPTSGDYDYISILAPLL